MRDQTVYRMPHFQTKPPSKIENLGQASQPKQRKKQRQQSKRFSGCCCFLIHLFNSSTFLDKVGKINGNLHELLNCFKALYLKFRPDKLSLIDRTVVCEMKEHFFLQTFFPLRSPCDGKHVTTISQASE